MSDPTENLLDRARLALKALRGPSKEAKNEKPVVPGLPDDPDRLDSRVGDSSPTEGDLDEAKEDGDGAGDGFDENGHKDMNPEDLGGDDEDETEEKEEKEEGEGESASRDVKKAFPVVGHLLPDEDLLDLDEGPTGMSALMSQFAGMIGKQNAILEQMVGRITDLQKGMDKNHEALHSQGRTLKKALTENAEIKTRMDKIHETAPAAKPRAVAKSLDSGPVSQSLSFSDVDALSRTGGLPSHEIAMLCQSSVRGTTY